MNWRGWAGGATAAAIGAAALTVGLTRWLETRYEQRFAARMAATTAAYIAAVTPAPIPPPPPRPPVARRGRTAPRPLPVPPPAPVRQRQPRGFDLAQLLTQSRALRTLPGWTSDVEVYYGTAPLIDVAEAPLDSAKIRGALAALRDREGRLVGAVAIRPHRLARGPLPGGIGFAVPAALLAIAAAAGIAFKRRPLRRGGYAIAAMLLAVAAYADVRAAASQSTDRWLMDTRRLVQEAATRLPAPRSRVAVDELVPLVGDAELVAGDPGESAPQRVRIDGRRRAVAAVLIGPGRWLELRTVPAEDATIGWGLLLLTAAFVGPLFIWTLRWAERTPQRKRRETALAWSFLAPTVLHLVVFSVAPLFFLLYLALHSHSAFVGLTNFRTVLRDPLSWLSLRNTAVYVFYVPISAAIALLVALALHGHARSSSAGGRWIRRLVRGAFLAPYVSSVVAIAIVWQIGFAPIDAFSSPRSSLVAIMVLSVWAHVGGQMVVFLAALEAVPRAYLDAACVDGAGAWRRFWRITFPLLRPVILFVLAAGVVSALQIFTLIRVLTPGVETVAHRVYALGRVGGADVGAASALALVLFAAVALFATIQLRFVARRTGVGRA